MKGLSDHATIEAVLCILARRCQHLVKLALHDLDSALTTTSIESSAMDIHSNGHFHIVYKFLSKDVYRHTILTTSWFSSQQLFPGTSVNHQQMHPYQN
jgi:hypothetical protein